MPLKCITCLRVSVRDWNEGDSVSLRPFSVACYAATYDGKNCSYCNSLYKPCETVPKGVEGHRFELRACLSWVDEFWSNKDGGYGISFNDNDEASEFLLPRELIDAVAVCVRHLVASFDNFVKAHRRVYSLPGTYLPQACIETKDAYSHYEPEWVALVAESTQYYRLRPAEESARSWYTGIVAFRQDIQELV
ncbi:hypothetical protein AAEP93_010886 [Penicillium crustosum]